VDVEAVLGSKGRLRIIRELAGSQQPLTLYHLERRTGIRRKTLKSDLTALIESGFVEEVSIAGVKKYALSVDREEVRELLDCLYRLGYLSSASSSLG
jgi:DNA-binding HxlR family transcriptional regulator